MVPVFLTGGVLECDLAHRRSVAVLCLVYKITCDLMHPFYGPLPVPYVPVRVTMLLWVYIGILMHLLVAKTRTTDVLLFSSQCFCKMILLILFLMACVSPWKIYDLGLPCKKAKEEYHHSRIQDGFDRNLNGDRYYFRMSGGMSNLENFPIHLLFPHRS